jgi:molybdenum cofactor cytidylyltransferase
MKNMKFDKINISVLFDKEPKAGWGSRGNPHLWDEMRLRSKNIKLLKNEKEMKNYFYKLFSQITGIDIIDKEYTKINRYLLDSGISNGIVTSSWWIETGIPILLKRYNEIKSNYDSNNDIINMDCIKYSNKDYENSIEEAIKRIFMFDEINIDNLMELLSFDNNIDKITKKTKKEIIQQMKYKMIDENIIRTIEAMILNKSKKNGA